jgi:hypothetical protein
MQAPVPPMSCRQHHWSELHVTGASGENLCGPLAMRGRVQDLAGVDTTVLCTDADALVASVPASASADSIASRNSFFMA